MSQREAHLEAMVRTTRQFIHRRNLDKEFSEFAVRFLLDECGLPTLFVKRIFATLQSLDSKGVAH